MYGFSSLINCCRPNPRVRRVMSRIRPLNLSRAFGAMRRSLPSFEMLNPRNFRSPGRATALFASLTLSRSLLVKNRLTEGHDPLAGTTAANIDVAVVGIPAKAVTASGQFFVEVVKHEIAKDGRKRAALRRPLIHRTDQTVFHHPGVE